MSNLPIEVSVKTRDYKLTPQMLQAYADEWVGKEAALTISSDEITFEFILPEYAEGFRKTIAQYKIA